MTVPESMTPATCTPSPLFATGMTKTDAPNWVISGATKSPDAPGDGSSKTTTAGVSGRSIERALKNLPTGTSSWVSCGRDRAVGDPAAVASAAARSRVKTVRGRADAPSPSNANVRSATARPPSSAVIVTFDVCCIHWWMRGRSASAGPRNDQKSPTESGSVYRASCGRAAARSRVPSGGTVYVACDDHVARAVDNRATNRSRAPGSAPTSCSGTGHSTDV